MEFDKKTMMAIALIGVVFIFAQTEFYKKRFMPTTYQKERKQSLGVSDSVKSVKSKEEVETDTPSVPEVKAVVEPREAELVSMSDDSLIVSGSGVDIKVESDLYIAIFSTRGGALKSFRLKNYPDPNGGLVELVGAGDKGNLGLKFPTENDTMDTEQFLFKANKERIVVSRDDPNQVLQFTLDLGGGAQVVKAFNFQYSKYDIELTVQLSNMKSTIDGFSYALSWETGIPSSEIDFKDDMLSAKGYFYQGEVENFDTGAELSRENFEGITDWVAIRSKYFTAAVMPVGVKGKRVDFRGDAIDVGLDAPLKVYSYDIHMPFDKKAERIDKFVLFLGPLDYEMISGFNVKLEDMMDLGYSIFRPIGKLVTWSFRHIHRVVPNYGIVLIIFSILVKLVLFPLTRKSYKSMKEMQLLQPIIQELNDKHKDSPQKKQEETMKLYKEYGINPLGGCIPLVLQMPLFIALFSVFRFTIELRGAYFAGWITDLSRPDTVFLLPFSLPFYGNAVNILPLLMGLTTFVQQKITMKDPKQKAMVYFMPIMLVFLFNNWPSGLNLYYTLFNLLSIVQEKFIPYKIRTPEEMKKRKTTQVKKQRVKHDYKGRFK